MKRLFAALAICAGPLVFLAPTAAVAQGGINPAFFGTWCAEGNPNRQASIVANGPFVTLTNEQGSTSTAMRNGSGGIMAPMWDVQGTLGPGQHTIGWTNGTFWRRCGRDQWGPGWQPGYMPGNLPVGTLGGRWYAQGRASEPCSASQRYGALTFRNQLGVVAHGRFTGRRHFVANWWGTQLTGTLREDARRIDWSNGTFWTRRPQ